MKLHPGLVYDAPPILGLGKGIKKRLPDATLGEVVIRVGAWSITDLRSCQTIVSDKLLFDCRWYEQHEWRSVRLTPRVYRVRLRIPGSNKKAFPKRSPLLLPGEDLISVALAATVLFCHLKQTGENLLDGDWTRCTEAGTAEHHVRVGVNLGRVNIDECSDGSRRSDFWLGGYRQC